MVLTRPNLEVPRAFLPLFDKTNPYYHAEHLTWYGGRGAAKSWQIGRGVLGRMLDDPMLVLCGREYQNSIDDSVYAVLEGQARLLGIHNRFRWLNNRVIADNGSEAMFKGLGRNIDSIKSLEDVKLAWLVEARTISRYTLEVLLPTIRRPNSQIITDFNTGLASDPIYKELVTRHQESNYLCKVTYLNNPYLPDKLRRQAERMRATDYDRYKNIWLGDLATRNDAQVLKDKFKVARFTRPETVDGGNYFGLDWGFSVDPTAGNRSYIKTDAGKTRLFIDREIYKVGVEVTDLGAFVAKLVDSKKDMIRADNARPELISHLKREGFTIQAALKWKGSIEDGITYLRSFDEIVIHEDCINTIKEAELWAYKTDKITGEPLSELVDANNHSFDALRYGIQPLIKPPPMPSIRVA